VDYRTGCFVARMQRPPTSMLEAKFACSPPVDTAAALEACVVAARQCNFCVAARESSSLVLMPCPKRQLMSCVAPGQQQALRASRSAGRGIVAEVIVGCQGGYSLAVSMPRATGTEAFIQALQAELDDRRSGRVKSVGGHQRGVDAQPPIVDQHPAEADPFEMDNSSFKRKAAAYYYVTKILTDKHQVPGAETAEFVRLFVERYSTLATSAADSGSPMTECSSAIDHICELMGDVLASAHASGDVSSAVFRPWVRPSVERCIFSRVGMPLWRFYESRHAAQDERYSQKWRLLSSVSDTRLLTNLEVRREFRGEGAAASSTFLFPKDGSSICSHQTPSTDVDSNEATSHIYEHAPIGAADCDKFGSIHVYERAIAALSEVETAFRSGLGSNPRKAVEALMFSQLELKTCALELSGGQAELCAMDDIMPLFLFILSRSSLRRPFACAKVMHDSLTGDERLDCEGRAVTLLESAARYIAEEWDIKGMVSTA